MTSALSPVQTSPLFHLRLVAPCPLAGGLTPVLARQLGISPADLSARLAAGTGVLVDGLEGGQAARLVPLLRAMGLAVAAEDSRGSRVDLALLPDPQADAACRSAAAASVARLLERDSVAVECALRQPGGLLLDGLTRPEADRLRSRLKPVAGLHLVLSDPAVAVCDLYQTRPLKPQHGVALLADLRRLGLGPCRLTGALAAAMDRQMAAWLVRRHGAAGVVALDRAFQRFDLLLTGTGRMPAAELADFLCPRTGLSRDGVARVRPDRPLRIETALPHAAARQFSADYAAIGLPTRLRLTRG